MHERDLVVLDTQVNDYLVLADAGEAVDFAEGSMRIVDQDLATMLVRAELGATGPGPQAPRRWAKPAGDDLTKLSTEPATLREALDLAVAVTSLLWSYRFRRLETLMGRSTSASQPLSEAVATRLTRRALVFRRLLPWVPFQGQCLYRAALLRRFLGTDRDQVDWVFGVTTWPFAAHCWLQIGDLVINDRLDRVSRYTPIMVA